VAVEVCRLGVQKPVKAMTRANRPLMAKEISKLIYNEFFGERISRAEIRKILWGTLRSRIIYNGDILSPLQAGSSISAIDSSIIASNNNELYIEVEETLNCANLCGFYA